MADDVVVISSSDEEDESGPEEDDQPMPGTSTGGPSTSTNGSSDQSAGPSRRKKKKSPRETLHSIVVYPANTKGGARVTVDDYERLRDGRFVNDALIEFYLKHLELNELNDEQRRRSLFMGVFFFSRLMDIKRDPSISNDELARLRHQAVSSWTNSRNIFEKDFIFIPANESKHWYLIVICFPWMLRKRKKRRKRVNPMSKTERAARDRLRAELRSRHQPNENPTIKKRPCLLVFDSLHMKHRESVTAVRSFLELEWQAKYNTYRSFGSNAFKAHYMKAPKQPNFVDCGCFLMQYALSFHKHPICNYNKPIREVVNWFDLNEALRKRKELQNLIFQELNNQNINIERLNLPELYLRTF